LAQILGTVTVPPWWWGTRGNIPRHPSHVQPCDQSAERGTVDTRQGSHRETKCANPPDTDQQLISAGVVDEYGAVSDPFRQRCDHRPGEERQIGGEYRDHLHVLSQDGEPGREPGDRSTTGRLLADPLEVRRQVHFRPNHDPGVGVGHRIEDEIEQSPPAET